MESQSTEVIGEPDKKIVCTKPRSCVVAWSTVGLLCITWIFLVFIFIFLWQREHDDRFEYLVKLTQMQQQFLETQTQYQELQKDLTQVQNFVQKKFSAAAAVELSSINQLIWLADYNLIYLHDQDSALLALRFAKRHLAELDNLPISTGTLRNLLAQNIASLESLPGLDLNNVLAKFGDLQMRITQLPLRGSMATTQVAKADQDSLTTVRQQWLDLLKTCLHNLQQLIIIQHLDRPIEPLLPQIQQQYLQYNLQLLLQQAQWALLHRQKLVYQISLRQIKEAVQRQAAENASVTQAVMRYIEELQRIELEPTLPDLSPTLAAIATINRSMAMSASTTAKPVEQRDHPL